MYTISTYVGTHSSGCPPFANSSLIGSTLTSASAPQTPIPSSPQLHYIIDALAHRQTVQIDNAYALKICELIQSLGKKCLVCIAKDDLYHEHPPPDCRHSRNRCLSCLSAEQNTSDLKRPCKVQLKMCVTDACYHRKLDSTAFISNHLGNHVPIP
jgi:hypothetical protein